MVYSQPHSDSPVRRLSSVVEQHFRKVEVPGSNPGGGSSQHPQQLHPNHVRILFLLSVVLQVSLWSLRASLVSLNPLPLVFALGMLLCNGLLQLFVLGANSIASLILGLGTAYVQLLVLILLVASRGS